MDEETVVVEVLGHDRDPHVEPKSDPSGQSKAVVRLGGSTDRNSLFGSSGSVVLEFGPVEYSARDKRRDSLPMGVVAAVVAAVAVLQPAVAYCAPVTFCFTGQVILALVIGPGPGGLANGVMVEGTYTFDSAAPDMDPNPRTGVYQAPSTSDYGITVRFGGSATSVSFGAPTIAVDDHFAPGSIDVYGVTDSPDFLQQHFTINLLADNPNVFHDDSLPLDPPDPNDFAHRGQVPNRLVGGFAGLTTSLEDAWSALFRVDTIERCLEIVDPAPDLLIDDRGSIDGNIVNLIEGGEVRNSVIADGVSPLLLRVRLPRAPSSGQVRFEIADPSANVGLDGGLSLLPGTLSTNAPLQTNIDTAVKPSTGGTAWAFAVYTPPLVAESEDDSLRVADIALPLSRRVDLVARADGRILGDATITVVNRPVVLVDAPNSDAFSPLAGYLEDRGYPESMVARVMPLVSGLAARFHPDVVTLNTSTPLRRLKETIEGQLRALHSSGIAGAQVDAVAFSSGGLVVRAFEFVEGGRHFRPKGKPGLGQRLIHKLITIDTPHNGSELADYALNGNSCTQAALLRAVPETYDGPEGYRRDEATIAGPDKGRGAVPILNGRASKLPIHAVGGAASDCQKAALTAVFHGLLTRAVLELQPAGQCTEITIFYEELGMLQIPFIDFAAQSFLFPGFTELLGPVNDTVVKYSSQIATYPHREIAEDVFHSPNSYKRHLIDFQCSGSLVMRRSAVHERVHSLLTADLGEFSQVEE